MSKEHLLELAAKDAEIQEWKDAWLGSNIDNDALRRKLAAAQAKIDALMLEYCPNEMTPEQIKEWGKHQVPVSEELTKQVEVAREALVRISANDVFDVLPKHRIAADALATLKGDVSIPDGWTATECKYCGSPCIERPMPENKHGRDNDADIAAALKG